MGADAEVDAGVGETVAAFVGVGAGGGVGDVGAATGAVAAAAGVIDGVDGGAVAVGEGALTGVSAVDVTVEVDDAFTAALVSDFALSADAADGASSAGDE